MNVPRSSFQKGRRLRYFIACWHDGLLDCRVAGLLARLRPVFLVYWIAGLLTGWLTGLLGAYNVGRKVGKEVCRGINSCGVSEGKR